MSQMNVYSMPPKCLFTIDTFMHNEPSVLDYFELLLLSCSLCNKNYLTGRVLLYGNNKNVALLLIFHQ